MKIIIWCISFLLLHNKPTLNCDSKQQRKDIYFAHGYLHFCQGLVKSTCFHTMRHQLGRQSWGLQDPLSSVDYVGFCADVVVSQKEHLQKT